MVLAGVRFSGSGVGGHIATYLSSAATMMEVGI